MRDLPLVSVVTCSYNNAAYIIDTLDSIKRQTYGNIELIIVEDGSTDNSVELITGWLSTYTGKYKFIRHDINKGGAIPYNAGLAHATGKYYTTVDSDDTIMPEKIERQVTLLETSGAEVAAVYSDAYVIDADGKQQEGLFIQRHRKFAQPPSGNIYGELLHGNFIPVMSLLIKRSVMAETGNYDEELVYGDYDMWLRIAKKYEVLFSDQISGSYRIRPGSLSSSIQDWYSSDTKILLKHSDVLLPTERIRNIATGAYFHRKNAAMPLIAELASKTNDICLATAITLWQHGIDPIDAGSEMLDYITRSADGGRTFNYADTDKTNFLHDIISHLEYDLLKKLAFESYFRNNRPMIPFIKKIAAETRDKYLKAVLVLWKYRVHLYPGQIILKRVDIYCRIMKAAFLY